MPPWRQIDWNLTAIEEYVLLGLTFMRLRVTNLGPIEEAEIDLSKPLIILTGPNNSGKTYLSWVVYSLARLNVRRVTVPPELYHLANELLTKIDPSILWETLRSIGDTIIRNIADCVQTQLATDFAAPKDRFAKTRIEILVDQDEIEKSKREGLLVMTWISDRVMLLQGRAGELVLTSFPTENKDLNVRNYLGSEKQKNEHEVAFLLMSFWANMCLERETRAFPVERLAVNLFARELGANRTGLVDALLTQTSDETSDSTGPENLRNQLQRHASRYPLVIRDALQQAMRMPQSSEPGPFAALAAELEHSILGGQVRVNALDELEFAPRGTESSKISLGLHESASIVKSLASLVLFLRYDAWPGQRLLIDEPELNLHPDNQRRVARILAKAANKGLKILMSTHSDYMIREFNNLIMLGQDTDQARELIQELDYDPETTLKSEHLGVYLVDQGKCIRLPVLETGFEISTIDKALHELNRDAQTIYLRLFTE